jgi:putative transposase
MQPETRLVGDITYLHIDQGWLYLAVVLELATRMITGWQIATRMRTSLITDALEMARLPGHVAPGTIFHSDSGLQPEFKESSQHRPLESIVDARSAPLLECVGITLQQRVSLPR